MIEVALYLYLTGTADLRFAAPVSYHRTWVACHEAALQEQRGDGRVDGVCYPWHRRAAE